MEMGEDNLFNPNFLGNPDFLGPWFVPGSVLVAMGCLLFPMGSIAGQWFWGWKRWISELGLNFTDCLEFLGVSRCWRCLKAQREEPKVDGVLRVLLDHGEKDSEWLPVQHGDVRLCSPGTLFSQLFWTTWFPAFIYTLAVEILITGIGRVQRHCSIVARVIGASGMVWADSLASRFVLLSLGGMWISNCFTSSSSLAPAATSRDSFPLFPIFLEIWVEVMWAQFHTDVLIHRLYNGKVSSLLLAACLVGCMAWTVWKIVLPFVNQVTALQGYAGLDCKRAWKLFLWKLFLFQRRIGVVLSIHVFFFMASALRCAMLLCSDGFDTLKLGPFLFTFLYAGTTSVALGCSVFLGYCISSKTDAELARLRCVYGCGRTERNCVHGCGRGNGPCVYECESEGHCVHREEENLK